MTLEKAIIHAEAVAKAKEREAKKTAIMVVGHMMMKRKNVLPVLPNIDSLPNG